MRLKTILLAISVLCLALPAFAGLSLGRLSDEDIATRKVVFEKLEPLIREREAKENLATLTFDELYAPLNDSEKEFLKYFQDLDAQELGVKIPFRGIATGKEGLVAIKDQEVKMKGEPATLPPQFLPKNVHDAYLQMMEAMQKDIGKRLYVESGYRSSAYQLYLFVFYLQNHDYSIKETVRWVALPGYSEHGASAHQAIDFINANGVSGETDPKEFEDLEEYRWLLEHAQEFGFVLSYPKDAPAGITFEPWHWRYDTVDILK